MFLNYLKRPQERISDIKDCQASLIRPKTDNTIQNIQDNSKKKIVRKPQIPRIILKANNDQSDSELSCNKFLGSQEELSLSEIRQNEEQQQQSEQNNFNYMNYFSPQQQLIQFDDQQLFNSIQLNSLQLKLKQRRLKFLLPKLNNRFENDGDLVLNFKNLMNFTFNDDNNSIDNQTRPNTKPRPPNRRIAIPSHAITVDKQNLNSLSISMQMTQNQIAQKNSFAHDLSLNQTLCYYQLEKFDQSNLRDELQYKFKEINDRKYTDEVDSILFDPLNREDAISIEMIKLSEIEQNTQLYNSSSSYSNFQQFSQEIQLARDDNFNDLESVHSDHLQQQQQQQQQQQNYDHKQYSSAFQNKRKNLIDDIVHNSSSNINLQTIKETLSQSNIESKSCINFSIALKKKYGEERAIAFYDILLLVSRDRRYKIQQDNPERFGDIICLNAE